MAGSGEQAAASPSAFVLTPKNLSKLADLSGRRADVLQDLSRLLERAKEEVFIPYLSSSRLETIDFNFERSAYGFFPLRVEATALLVKLLGSSTFVPKYFALVKLVAERFVAEAATWELDKDAVGAAFQKYFAGSVRLLSLATGVRHPSEEQLSSLLKAITKADFGLTVMAYVLEGTLNAEKWKMQNTFRLTEDAVSQYEQAVLGFIGTHDASSPVAGSLKLEGEIDSAELQSDLPLDWSKTSR